MSSDVETSDFVEAGGAIRGTPAAGVCEVGEKGVGEDELVWGVAAGETAGSFDRFPSLSPLFPTPQDSKKYDPLKGRLGEFYDDDDDTRRELFTGIVPGVGPKGYVRDYLRYILQEEEEEEELSYGHKGSVTGSEHSHSHSAGFHHNRSHYFERPLSSLHGPPVPPINFEKSCSLYSSVLSNRNSANPLVPPLHTLLPAILPTEQLTREGLGQPFGISSLVQSFPFAASTGPSSTLFFSSDTFTPGDQRQQCLTHISLSLGLPIDPLLAARMHGSSEYGKYRQASSVSCSLLHFEDSQKCPGLPKIPLPPLELLRKTPYKDILLSVAITNSSSLRINVAVVTDELPFPAKASFKQPFAGESLLEDASDSSMSFSSISQPGLFLQDPSDSGATAVKPVRSFTSAFVHSFRPLSNCLAQGLLQPGDEIIEIEGHALPPETALWDLAIVPLTRGDRSNSQMQSNRSLASSSALDSSRNSSAMLSDDSSFSPPTLKIKLKGASSVNTTTARDKTDDSQHTSRTDKSARSSTQNSARTGGNERPGSLHSSRSNRSSKGCAEEDPDKSKIKYVKFHYRHDPDADVLYIPNKKIIDFLKKFLKKRIARNAKLKADSENIEKKHKRAHGKVVTTAVGKIETILEGDELERESVVSDSDRVDGAKKYVPQRINLGNQGNDAASYAPQGALSSANARVDSFRPATALSDTSNHSDTPASTSSFRPLTGTSDRAQTGFSGGRPQTAESYISDRPGTAKSSAEDINNNDNSNVNASTTGDMSKFPEILRLKVRRYDMVSQYIEKVVEDKYTITNSALSVQTAVENQDEFSEKKDLSYLTNIESNRKEYTSWRRFHNICAL